MFVKFILEVFPATPLNLEIGWSGKASIQVLVPFTSSMILTESVNPQFNSDKQFLHL